MILSNLLKRRGKIILLPLGAKQRERVRERNMPLGKICATFHFRVDPESSPSQE